MPADDGLGAHDGDHLEHRAEKARGESEHDPISGTDAGFGTERRKAMICWRRTAFSARRAARERKAERSAARTVLKISMNIAAQDLARDNHPRNSDEICGRFDLVPSFCGTQGSPNDRIAQIAESRHDLAARLLICSEAISSPRPGTGMDCAGRRAPPVCPTPIVAMSRRLMSVEIASETYTDRPIVTANHTLFLFAVTSLGSRFRSMAASVYSTDRLCPKTRFLHFVKQERPVAAPNYFEARRYLSPIARLRVA